MGSGFLTGDNAQVYIGTVSGQTLGMSDFSLTLDRGTVEQELLGESANAKLKGALTVDGSYTNCRFGASGNAQALEGIIDGSVVAISGGISGLAVLQWAFASCQITGYDVSMGDSSTISEASIDFSIMNPFNVTYDSSTHKISG